jgi:Flp pilus assembly protein TadB
MNSQPVAAALTAAAVLAFPDGRAAARLAALNPKPARRRPWLPAVAAPGAAALSLALGVPALAIPAAAAAWWFARRASQPPQPKADSFRLAITWELLAAALRAGLPVSHAIQAVATDLPGAPGKALRTTADLLALGADPGQAWDAAKECPSTAPLARAARRSARSGTALAAAAAALADEVRASTEAAAEARAQRAAVLVSGPLGLCFLPAFICLGVVPVVASLATGISP